MSTILPPEEEHSGSIAGGSIPVIVFGMTFFTGAAIFFLHDVANFNPSNYPDPLTALVWPIVLALGSLLAVMILASILFVSIRGWIKHS